MDNVHGDYLLKRFREERDSVHSAIAAEVSCFASDPSVVRALARIHNRVISSFSEIEYQINRAFDDMEKERAKKEGGAS